MLLNSRLRLFLWKLKSRWAGPLVITQVFPYGTTKITDPDKGSFKINRHQLKRYLGHEAEQMCKEVLYLHEPSSKT